MKAKLLLLSLVAGSTFALPAHSQKRYENDFEQAEPGKLPDGFLVIDGAFAVREERGNKFLELPGAPLDTYSVLFGPPAKENVSVTARVFGSSKGRRYPTFAVGLNGASGYRLQVSPGKGALELFQGDEAKASAPFEWQSGQWTWLRLQVTRIKDGPWRITGKGWAEGTTEPASWAITFEAAAEPRSGRAAIIGSPFAGTPIRFDDLKVEQR